MKLKEYLFSLLIAQGFVLNGQTDGSIWIVAVSVYDYQNNDYLPDIEYSVKGAYEFAQIYQNRQLTKEAPKVLMDGLATRATILKTLKQEFVENTKVSKDDMIIFYFSGHGTMQHNRTGICGYDYAGDGRDLITDEDIIDIIEKSKAKHKICFVESCRDRGLGEDVLHTVVNKQQLEEFDKQRNEISGGIVFFSSAKSEQKAEGIKNRGGHFTYFLLEGLRGDADQNRDNFISVEEIFDYVERNVSELTNKRQTPQINELKKYDKRTPIMVVPKMIPDVKPKEPCEIDKVGDLCIMNNTQHNYIYIILDKSNLAIKRGTQECLYALQEGVFEFRATESRPGGGQYLLGGFNSNFQVRIRACQQTVKKIY